MKKIKTINKLLSSLTLLSPLSSIGFNNQYQNQQIIITESNNALNNYFATNEQRKMGDITVNVDGTTITSYVSGKGIFKVDPDITQINDSIGLDMVKDIESLDFSNATSLMTLKQSCFNPSHTKLFADVVFPKTINSIEEYAFNTGFQTNNLTFLSETPPNFAQEWEPQVTNKIYVPQGTKNTYTSAPNFSFDSSQVEEWAFDSSSANIMGDFSQLNVFSFETNETENSFSISGYTPENISASIFSWELIPAGETKTVPEQLSIFQGKIIYNKLPAGTYTFNIKATGLDWTKTTDNTITIVSEDPMILGETNINLIQNTSGSQQFSSSPESFSPDQWEILMTQGEKPDWLSIDNQGLLSWTEQSVKGTYTFKVKATNTAYAASAETQEITLNVYANTAQVQGETLIYTNQTGRKTYTFVSDPTGLVADQWEIIMDQGEKPAWLDINQNGLLTWIDISSHSSIIGKHSFKVKATNTATSLSAELQVVLNIYDKTAAIKGSSEINSKKIAGQEQYTFESFPEGLSADQWEIVMVEGDKPEWLSIDNQGLLSWTDHCTNGTYKMKIRITNDHSGLQFEKDVTLIIQNVNLPLILGLVIGLGIPVILAIAFIIWYLTKKKKTTVKI